MNVFGAIKDKISNVPQSISAGFKSLTSREDEPQEKFYCEEVSVNAGGDLLNKFQENWASLHNDAETNAIKAEAIDSTINHMYLQVEKENEVMNQFLTQASYLPELVLGLQATMELIGEVEGKVTDLESQLLSLQDLCEEQEMQTNRDRHLNELKLYRERKSVEIERVKAKLAQQHADKVAAYESKLQATLREKQAIFEETYTQAIQDYKVHGQTTQLSARTPGYMSQTSSAQAADLANITLDQDTKDLDAFLEADSGKVSTPEQPEPTKDEKTQQESDSDLEPQPIKVTEDSSDVETDNKTTQPENKTPEVDNKHASGDHEDSATATESADNTNTPEVEKANEEPEG